MSAATLRYLEGVATLAFRDDRCDGCGQCVAVCPHAVFRPRRGGVDVRDPDACMECGACARNCPRDALSVSPGTGCAYKILRDWLRGLASPP